MWQIKLLPDPINDVASSSDKSLGVPHRDSLAHVRIPIEYIFDSFEHQQAMKEDDQISRIALADYVSRQIAELVSTKNKNVFHSPEEHYRVVVKPLDRVTIHKRRHHRTRQVTSTAYPPYILQRTDVWCSQTELNIVVHVAVHCNKVDNLEHTDDEKKQADALVSQAEAVDCIAQKAMSVFLTGLFQADASSFVDNALRHIACAILQERIRSELVSKKIVAFIANGAILPRRSGASNLPMSSPPAIPFQAPPDSTMSQDVTVDMGNLRPFVNLDAVPGETTKVKLSGLCVPAGVTLIVGGGYHGKSTLLRTIAAGVYNKVPGDGREFCVSVQDAVSVRAEDGRYVNNCNVSAFISNLPTLPGIKQLETSHFSSREASGSTSQAANVSEAIEMGASALLVDEDVSAANFMARDGRMRALVADESITPLLYRVNGLYDTHGISSVVVVGGVGDWLDVPNNVILLDKYVASDATKKARSVSYQFSYGHVQYAGRGVVHRLPWEKTGTPLQRRPATTFAEQYESGAIISILEGGSALSIRGQDDEQSSSSSDSDEDGGIRDEHHGYIDMSRCEQVLGKKAQLYGCGLCVAWLLRLSRKDPSLGVKALLEKLDQQLSKENGMFDIFSNASERNFDSIVEADTWLHLMESTGHAFIPRRHEVAMALTRMRGITLEEIPVEDDDSEDAAALEEERRRKALADLWNSRRKKSNNV